GSRAPAHFLVDIVREALPVASDVASRAGMVAPGAAAAPGLLREVEEVERRRAALVAAVAVGVEPEAARVDRRDRLQRPDVERVKLAAVDEDARQQARAA